MSNFIQDKEMQKDVIGLIPAGGKATRIAPLPCSKELYPIAFQSLNQDGNLRPKVICHYLIEKMQFARISKAYIILRQGKWDIPSYFGDGKIANMHIAYLMMRLPFGVPYTIDQAYPFIKESIVAFGFPDIIFQPDNAFVKLLARQADANADIVLGLFLADQPHKRDMVELNEDGKVRLIDVKPLQTHLKYTWINAVWTPIFTRFMHNYLANIQDGKKPDVVDNEMYKHRELFVGNVIQAAIHKGLHVEAVLFSDQRFIDIGTPEDLVKAVRTMSLVSEEH